MAGMWYENAVFYGIDVRRFQDSNNDGFGDLRGLISRLDYLVDLGVRVLWLLPFFDTPLRDNGYDIRDYYRIDSRVGDLDDFIDLVQEARKRNLRLVIDLVMNHTSVEHPWFQASRRDPASRFRDYYSWTDSPPEKPAGGGPIFPGEEDNVWTFDSLADAYYFHRFYHFQPGLRIGNPEVREEIFKVVDFWLSLDVDGFRFDAAPIMTEAKGLEETKPDDPDKIFQEISQYITERKADAVLLGEANVSLEAMGDFFGGSSEMNMLFNFMLGPHILLAFARDHAGPLRKYLKNIYIPPEKDVWLNFLRNHDEFTLDKLSESQKEAVFQKYAPEPFMRIYERGIRRRLAPMLSEHGQGTSRQRIELAYSLLFSFPGTPLIMYGDEIGMGDNLALPGRTAVRTPMQWSKEENAGFSKAERLIAPLISEGPFGYKRINVSDQQSDNDSLLHFVKKLIALRYTFPEIGICPVQIIDSEEKAQEVIVSCYSSIEGNQDNITLYLFHNLSPNHCSTTVKAKPVDESSFKAKFGNGNIVKQDQESFSVDLPAYGYLWVRASS